MGAIEIRLNSFYFIDKIQAYIIFFYVCKNFSQK